MSLEPGVIDANILVYAMAIDAPQYAASRALLDGARDDPATNALCDFANPLRILFRCHQPATVTQARSTADALQAITGFLAFLHVFADPRPRR